ncbi:MAG TPA: hypothetical protein VEU55_10050 [Gemmatimonadales bacterium]|nr:hypothetical protein [Gemmatimonadales bacterium]
MPARPAIALRCTLGLGLLLLAAACGSSTGLPAAGIPNAVDTVSLYALNDGVVTDPSGFVLQGVQRVRTDQSPAVDFAFTFDSLHRPVLLPTQLLGLGALSSLQRAQTAFDAITTAPTGGWQPDSAVVADPGAVVLAASRPFTCFTGLTVSLYAKLRVLTVDTTAKRIDFEILVDQNCGYRGLQPGLPTQ